MMLNELLADEGLANRIAHIVVYNNGTANPATENDSGESTVSNGEQEKQCTRDKASWPRAAIRGGAGRVLRVDGVGQR